MSFVRWGFWFLSKTEEKAAIFFRKHSGIMWVEREDLEWTDVFELPVWYLILNIQICYVDQLSKGVISMNPPFSQRGALRLDLRVFGRGWGGGGGGLLTSRALPLLVHNHLRDEGSSNPL